jgi:uncharacterized SAM-binding protein YcdF (DUF218 family)
LFSFQKGRPSLPSASPALIIFGAAVKPGGEPSLTLRRRVEAALAFGRLCERPLYLVTGGLGTYPPAEARVMHGLLVAGGVDDADIWVEDSARDTLESVQACMRLLRDAAHAGPVFAVTSAYHLPRCLVLLRLAGLDAHAAPPPPYPASRRFVRRWWWRLREVPALPWDALLILAWRLRARSAILGR